MKTTHRLELIEFNEDEWHCSCFCGKAHFHGPTLDDIRQRWCAHVAILRVLQKGRDTSSAPADLKIELYETK